MGVVSLVDLYLKCVKAKVPNYIAMMAGLPTELAFELSGHQGPVRSVRLNSELRKLCQFKAVYILPSSMILKLFSVRLLYANDATLSKHLGWFL